jgi:hypothetical protein
MFFGSSTWVATEGFETPMWNGHDANASRQDMVTMNAVIAATAHDLDILRMMFS